MAKVIFKHEDNLDDQPVGPVQVVGHEGDSVDMGWLTLKQARDIAEILEVKLEEQ